MIKHSLKAENHTLILRFQASAIPSLLPHYTYKPPLKLKVLLVLESTVKNENCFSKMLKNQGKYAP